MQRIAAKAVKILLANGVNHFPIDPKSLYIPDCPEILCLDYAQGAQIIHANNLQEAAKTNNGMAVHVEDEYCILWNSELGIAEESEIIGHELAHIVLRHGICNKVVGGEKTALQETQAEVFKRELLIPTIVMVMMDINSVEQIQAITGVSENTAQSAYLEISRRKQLKDPFLSDDERALWEAFKERLPKSNPAVAPKEQKEQQECPHKIEFDFAKHLKWYKALVSIIGICVILLVILDCNAGFIPKGDYKEPQYYKNIPLTPGSDYNDYDDNFFEPKATKNNITPAKTNQSDNYTVYVTAHGEKYHRDNCRYLAQSKRAIDIYDAINEGYAPCSVCKP